MKTDGKEMYTVWSHVDDDEWCLEGRRTRINHVLRLARDRWHDYEGQKRIKIIDRDGILVTDQPHEFNMRSFYRTS